MLVDPVRTFINAGNGGRGSMPFRREKVAPKAGWRGRDPRAGPGGDEGLAVSPPATCEAPTARTERCGRRVGVRPHAGEPAAVSAAIHDRTHQADGTFVAPSAMAVCDLVHTSLTGVPPTPSTRPAGLGLSAGRRDRVG